LIYLEGSVSEQAFQTYEHETYLVLLQALPSKRLGTTRPKLGLRKSVHNISCSSLAKETEKHFESILYGWQIKEF
jgi:hypothetical protein